MQNNPWRCLAAYKEPRCDDKETYLFCGREKETYELVSLVRNNLYITLYGRTGIGKTSLLEAGVFPLLRKDNYVPIMVRFGSMNDSKKSFAELIVQSIEAQNLRIEKTNECAILPTINGKDNVEYLWEYFATRHFYDGDHKVFPVIVLDQFEENLIAARYKSEVLLEQIYALVDDNKEFPTGYHSETNFRFIISIREDELYRLEESIDRNHLVDFKKNRYRLTYLSKQSAEDVICIPGKHLLPENKQERREIVNKILKQSTDEDSDNINTLLLSLVCSCLYERCITKKTKVFTINDINSLGKNLLVDFYKSLPIKKQTRKIIEDKFIDAQGRRNMVNIDDLNIPKSELDELCNGNRHILQKSNKRIELVHDLLAYAIFETKQQKLQKDSGRTLKIYLALLFLIIFIVGLLGSIFSFSESNSSGRLPIFPQKTKSFVKDEGNWIKDENYIETIIYENSTEGNYSIHIENCTDLKRVILRKTIKRVNIKNCPSLKYLILPDSLQVGKIYLEGCPNLKTLYIPNEVEAIFSDRNLSVIPTSSNSKYIVHDGIVWDIETPKVIYANLDYTNHTFYPKDSIFVVFPRQLWRYGTRGIPYNLENKDKVYFYNNGKVTQNGFIVDAKDSTHIISYRYIGKDIDLSNMQVGDGAFENCENLKSITINAYTTLGEHVFSNCPKLKNVIINQSPKRNPKVFLYTIGNLLNCTRTVLHPLNYEISGEGPLRKDTNGIIFYNDMPVLISNESDREYICKTSGDTTHICTKGWLVQKETDRNTISGQPLITAWPDTAQILNSYSCYRFTDHIHCGYNAFYLEDSFTKGLINGHVFCRNLTKKDRTFYIATNRTYFKDLADSVKQEIQLFVPYGTLDQYLYNSTFDGFKDLREMSLLQTMAFNAMRSFDNATGYFSNNTHLLILFVIGIALLLIFLWYLAYIRLTRQQKTSFIIIKSLISSLSITVLAFFVWIATYWFLWFWIFYSSTLPNGNIILSTIVTIVALATTFFVYKNILYQIKNINLRRIKLDLQLLIKRQSNKLFVILFLLIILGVSRWYIKRIHRAESIYKIAQNAFNTSNNANKTALYVLTKNLQEGNIPSTSIKDSIYALLDTLAYETGYNIEHCDSCLSPVNAISLSPNGELLLLGGNHGIIQVWDINQRKTINTINCNTIWDIDECKWINDSTFIADTWADFYYSNIIDSRPLLKSKRSYYKSIIEISSNRVYYKPQYRSNEINILDIKDNKLIETGTSLSFKMDDIEGILKYQNNLLVYDNYTLNEYNPETGTTIQLYTSPHKISSISIGNNHKKIVAITTDSIYNMDIIDNKLRIIRSNCDTYGLTIIPSAYSGFMLGNYRGKLFKINETLDEYSPANRYYIAKDIDPKEVIISKDEKSIYAINKDDKLCIIPLKPTRKKLLETISKNFIQENYLLSYDEKKMYGMK